MWLNILLTLCLVLAMNGKRADLKNECLLQGDLSRVYKAKSIYWYGLDLSALVVINDPRIAIPAGMRQVYAPDMVDYFKKEETEDVLHYVFRDIEIKDVTKDFEKKRYMLADTTGDPAKLVVKAEDEILASVSESGYSDAQLAALGLLNTPAIKGILKTYELNETEGIGCVIIVPKCDHSTRAAFCYTTFFDVKTREPIWICKTIGYILPVHMGSSLTTRFDYHGGYSRDWAYAMGLAFDEFANGFYDNKKYKVK